jgi:hypothetical protein
MTARRSRPVIEVKDRAMNRDKMLGRATDLIKDNPQGGRRAFGIGYPACDCSVVDQTRTPYRPPLLISDRARHRSP